MTATATTAPGVRITRAKNAGGIQNPVGIIASVLLLPFTDGESVNGDRKLYSIPSTQAAARLLGRDIATSPSMDIVNNFLDIGAGGLQVGRLVGAGGAKALTAQIPNIQGVTANVLRGTWRGIGLDGNLYRLKVEKGPLSTANTGAGRVDTRVSIVLISSGLIVSGQFLDGVMDPTSTEYLVTRWNQSGFACTLAHTVIAATYAIAEEPAVADYAFTGGTDAAGVSSTERQLAVDALVMMGDNLQLASIGVLDWPPADLNYLAGKADQFGWDIKDYRAEGFTTGQADTHHTALTVNPASIATYKGWGIRSRNVTKSIPALGMVLALSNLRANATGGIRVDDTGANQADDTWVVFEIAGDRDVWASFRVNPVYSVSNVYQSGVIIGDVCTHSVDKRYFQLNSRRVDNIILKFIIQFLENVVKLNENYKFETRVNNAETDLTQATYTKILEDVTNIMKIFQNAGMIGAKGKGWDWSGSTIDGVDGPEPQFLLGTDPAKLGRIFRVELGPVSGRFGVKTTK